MAVLALTTATEVDKFCKVNADDLRLTEQEYTEFITKLITFASATILRYLNRKDLTQADLDADEIMKAELESACLRLIQNYLLVNTQAKTSPIVNVDEFTVSFPDRRVFTNDIRDDLKAYRILKANTIPSLEEVLAEEVGWV